MAWVNTYTMYGYSLFLFEALHPPFTASLGKPYYIICTDGILCHILTGVLPWTQNPLYRMVALSTHKFVPRRICVIKRHDSYSSLLNFAQFTLNVEMKPLVRLHRCPFSSVCTNRIYFDTIRILMYQQKQICTFRSQNAHTQWFMGHLSSNKWLRCHEIYTKHERKYV